MSNVLSVILLIAFFGLLAVGAIAAFIISVLQQRQYDTSALPDLGNDEEEVVETLPDDDSEVVAESRFENLDDELVLEDAESQQLMQTIVKAGGDTPTEDKQSKSILGGFTQAFKRTSVEEKKEEGQAHADSQ